uniref:Uncharacterized protein n=1 Tax=Vespula pensylvanica TaxID=30213 RepID=A0A834P5I7_VESPE|nr:hypothetical protein H0235_005793 [Vespula pensylvanica]
MTEPDVLLRMGNCKMAKERIVNQDTKHVGRREEEKKKKKRKEGRKVKNRAGWAKHCVLIDVSNPGRIVLVEINGAGVKKQNTCLCYRSTHRRNKDLPHIFVTSSNTGMSEPTRWDTFANGGAKDRARLLSRILRIQPLAGLHWQRITPGQCSQEADASSTHNLPACRSRKCA